MIYISLFLLAIYSNCFSFLMHFLFFKLIYLNWRIITLQYCDSLCHTSTWIGHRYTSVPSLLNTRPTALSTRSLQVVTEHQLWVPCIIHQTPIGCFTCGNVYVSMVFSQIIPPSPLPLSPKVCSLCLCLLCCLAYRIISPIFPDSIYMC